MCTIGESEYFTWTTCHKIIDWTTKGIQGHFCMDTQRP